MSASLKPSKLSTTVKGGALALLFCLTAQAGAEWLPNDRPTGFISMIETNWDSKQGIKVDGNSKDPYRMVGSFIEVIDTEKWEIYKKNGCSNLKDPKEKADKNKCPKFEWSVPYLLDPLDPFKSGVEVSKDIAKALIDEWQKFQDKVHWATQIAANNHIDPVISPPAMAYEFSTTWCNPAGLPNAAGNVAKSAAQALFNWKDINNPKVDVLKNISVYKGDIYKDAKIPEDKFAFKAHHPSLNLPWGYNPIVPAGVPAISRQEACEHIWFNWLPDIAFVYVPNGRWCPGGFGQGACIPLDLGLLSTFPQPVTWTDWGAPARRAIDACTAAVRSEYKEYVQNITKLLATKMPLALYWNGFAVAPLPGETSGVVFQPVAGMTPSLMEIAKIAKDSGDVRAYNYFLAPKNLVIPYADLDRYKSGRAGAWRLEELKRWAPPGTLPEQEKMGYTTLFQMWNQTDTVMEQRQIVYWYHAVECTGALWWYACISTSHARALQNIVATPQGCHFAGPESGTMQLTAPRFYYRWVTVPEGGFQIPGIKGHPINP